MKKLLISTLLLAFTISTSAHNKKPGSIPSGLNHKVNATFDIVKTHVRVKGTHIIFSLTVRGAVGKLKPKKNGKLAGSDVFSYVWPTSLDSSEVGFESGKGILALVMTAHPDFDDTPLYDENQDGNTKNDGNLWHSHWVVLVKDSGCGKDALKVRDIPKGAKIRLPKTWPGLPIYIDSPGYDPTLKGNTVTIRVPLKDVGFKKAFNYDGVTAGLRINANVHNPLLCVVKVHDIASGNLSLPGKAQ